MPFPFCIRASEEHGAGCSRELRAELRLGGGFVGNRLGGQEIGGEAFGVGSEELFDAFGGTGFKDESGVVVFLDPFDDFGVVVGGSVRFLLAGQRDYYACVVFACLGELVGHLPCCDFEMSPFAPQVDAGGGFDHIGDVGTADAGGDFEEIEAVVAVSLQEFRVGYAAHQSQTLN